MERKQVILKGDLKIPNSDVLLESGDKISYCDKKVDESWTAGSTFEKFLPHNMMFKQYSVVGDVLYWITRETFDISEIETFKQELVKHTPFKKALVISRYDSSLNYYKDFKDDESVFIDTTIDEGVVKSEIIGKFKCITLEKEVERHDKKKKVRVARAYHEDYPEVEFRPFNNFGSWTISANAVVEDDILKEAAEVLAKYTGIEKLKESFGHSQESMVPAIAQAVTPAINSKITSVIRKDSVYNTCVAMGLPTKINAMKNVVVSVKDMAEAGAVLETIYQQFGIKGSFMVTWEGNGKIYFDPRTPVDTKMQIAYAKAHNMALPSTDPKRLIGY